MDVVVTVPKSSWEGWKREGDLPGDAWGSGDAGRDGEYYFFTSSEPDINPGDRVYVVAHGRLRGYAPLDRVEYFDYRSFGLVRKGGAVAVTIDTPIGGFRGYRYRWWDRADEHPFPDWMTEGVK